MARVSEKKVDEKLMRSFFDRLTDVIVRIGSPKSGRSFLYEFFGPAERTMIVKRFAVILLLSRDVPWHLIEKKLGVSASTTQRLAKRLDRGGYEFLAKITKDPSVSSELLRAYRKILPPRGRGRWRRLYEL